MPHISAERLILEIVRASGGELTGKTRLFKAFYFAHLLYSERNVGLLTDWPIAHMPQGPGIHDCRELFDSLVRNGFLVIDQIRDEIYPGFRYRLTVEAQSAERPDDEIRAAVQRAVDFVNGKTGSQLSQLTHDHSRSWIEGATGDFLNIYVDMIPDDEYEKRSKQLAELDTKLRKAIGINQE